MSDLETELAKARERECYEFIHAHNHMTHPAFYYQAGFDAAADIAREVVAEKDAKIALLKASLQASPVGELTARALQAEKSFADERACCESHQDAYHRIKSELDIVKMNAESIKRFCETNHAPGVAPDK
jgi:DNA-binding PucR family transcriptional regulator